MIALILLTSPAIADDAPLRPIGTNGKAEKVLKADAETALYEYEGSGCLTHFWFGGNFAGVEDTRIRYYIDGEEQPSIDMQLYLCHGIGFNDNQSSWATKHVGNLLQADILWYGRKSGIGAISS